VARPPHDRTGFSTSGLWNVDHVHHRDTGFPDLPGQLIQRSIRPFTPLAGRQERTLRSLVKMATQRRGPGRRLSEVSGSGLAKAEPFLARPAQAGCGPPALAAPRSAALERSVS
jgi:hypothetical protein